MLADDTFLLNNAGNLQRGGQAKVLQSLHAAHQKRARNGCVLSAV